MGDIPLAKTLGRVQLNSLRCSFKCSLRQVSGLCQASASVV